MSLKRTSYTDADGRKKLVLLPENAPDSEAEMGIPVGPPSLEELGLPQEMEIRLNNELFNRNIFTVTDANKNRSEIVSAIQSAFKVDANRVVAIYIGREQESAYQEPAEDKPNKTIPYRRPRPARKSS